MDDIRLVQYNRRRGGRIAYSIDSLMCVGAYTTKRTGECIPYTRVGIPLQQISVDQYLSGGIINK